MKKFFTLFLTLMTSVMLWAYDFQSGDLCYNITSNVAPYTVEVTYQKSWSSSNYSDLTTVTIPESIIYNGTAYSVTSIGDKAFLYCSSLTSITIPNNVTSIGESTFLNCSSLTSITIPESVTSIGINAFYDCSSLTSITIPSSVTSIGSYAFYNTGIYNNESNWENGVLYISNYLIGIKTYISGTCIIKEGTRIIGYGAFENCSSLTSITIPNSVTSIGDGAFKNCSSLTSITIPNSVTSIGDGAFENCPSLTSMTVENGNTVYDSRESCNAIIKTATDELFAGCQNTIIPNSVTSIGSHAFTGCSSLTSITIPNSVTSIEQSAFLNCSSLTSITIPNSVTGIVMDAFAGCSSLTSIIIPSSVTGILGGGGLEECSSLTSIVVDEGNTKYDSRENCNAIIETATNTLITGCKNTIIPNSVTSIGSYAFTGCSSLTSITIPESVTSIGNSAFSGCSSLNTIYVEATNPPALGANAFTNTSVSTCYIPCGTKAAYEASDWASQVSEFVEDCDYGSYSRTVRIGYNTICLPHGSSNFTGATFYEIAHILKNNKKIFFDEVKTLEAGKPYIFYPHNNEVTIYYDNTTSAVPLSHNGLHGTFDGITAASNFLKGKYLVAGNRMVLCGDGCSLAANRAYIELDEISDKDHPAIPGIKRVSMDYSEENATTALDNITDETIVAPIQEGVYDILGRKVDAPTVSGFYIINGKKVFIAL